MDNLPSTQIKQLCQELKLLLDDIHSKTFKRDIIKNIQQFSTSLLNLVEQQRDLSIAQLQFTENEFEPLVNYVFKSALSVCLISTRNNVNKIASIQLINISILLTTATPLKPLRKISVQNSVLKQILSAFYAKKHDLYISLWQISKHIHLPISVQIDNLNRFNFLQQIFFIALKLVNLTIANQIHFSKAVRKIALDCPPSWHPILRTLLIYPTLVPPGTVIKNAQDEVRICIGVNNQDHILKVLNTEQSENQALTCGPLSSSEKVTIYPPQKWPGAKKMNQLWGQDWQAFLLDRENVNSQTRLKTARYQPSIDFLEFQSEIDKPAPKIERLLDNVSKDKELCTFLLTEATKANRKNQDVSDIRQALLILGIQQTYLYFLHICLIKKLSDQYFPLKQSLMLYAQRVCKNAVYIAQDMTEQQKAIIPLACLFSVAYFFLSPKVKSMTKWQLNKTHHFLPSALFAGESPLTASQFAQTLAKNWAPNNQELSVCLNLTPLQTYAYTTVLDNTSAAIGLAFIVTRRQYFAEFSPCAVTENFMSRALESIGLTVQQLDFLIQGDKQINHLYCCLP